MTNDDDQNQAPVDDTGAEHEGSESATTPAPLPAEGDDSPAGDTDQHSASDA